MTPTDDPANDVDPESVSAFRQQLVGWYTGGRVTLLVDVGHRAGLFEAAAGAGSLTSAQLAQRANASERHVREWLAGMVTAGIFTYDAGSSTYALPASHAVALTGDRASNIAYSAAGLALHAAHVPAVTRTMIEGGGIPYADYRPAFTTFMDQLMRRSYDESLLDGFIGSVPGLSELLAEGVRVADLGCGTGHTTNLLARAFPASTFVGYDISQDALDAGRDEATSWNLDNVTFMPTDVAQLAPDEPLGVIVAFDAIHDQARPADVLAAARRSLSPHGLFVAVDTGLSSNLEDNIGKPIAIALYNFSLFHCMQVSLAEGGAGLGAGWGRQLATQMLRDAGFDAVTIYETPPNDPMNAIYVGRA